MKQFTSIVVTILSLVAFQSAAHAVVIDFDFFPGPDGMLGTGDDVPVIAPNVFNDQPEQLTDQYAALGILFTPDPPVEDKNEILSNDSFGGTLPAESEPNLLTTRASAGGIIEAEFTIPVFEVGALVGLEGGTPGNTLTIFDALDNPLGSVFGINEFVSISSVVPIARFTVTDTVPAIDNLTFTVGSGVVPEPSAIAIWGLLGLTITGYTRLRRRK